MNKVALFVGMLTLLVLRGVAAQAPSSAPSHAMTESQATTWVQNHWKVQDIVPIVRDLSTLLNTPPSISGPQMTAILAKNGTLHVYWTSPNAVLKWTDPNNSKTLLEATVPLPTLTQPNFYKPPGFPWKAVAVSTTAGLLVGIIGTLVGVLVIK